MCNDINMAFDIHKEVILVLLDLSSAFDMIDHEILITRLAIALGSQEQYSDGSSLIYSIVPSLLSSAMCSL